MNAKYTKEILEDVVKSSNSVADVMRKLNVRRAGGSHSHLSRRIKYFGIDISHFTGKTLAKGRPGTNKKTWQEILILRTDGRREYALKLRRALIEYGRKYKCEICMSEPMWMGKELRFHVDHKSRNWLDNRPENLRFLCPNCHSQTDGFSGSKGFTDVMDDRRGQRIRRKQKMAL